MSATHAVTVTFADDPIQRVVYVGAGDVARRVAARLAQLPGELGIVGVSSVPADALDGGDDARSPEPVFAHVHAQQFWHDTVRVAADRGGAAAIAAAALTALVEGSGAAQLFCADGEGYDFVVTCSDPDADESLDDASRWVLPYVDPIAGGVDQVRGDHDVAAVLDAFDGLGTDERAAVPAGLSAAISALRSRCRGALLAPDDPRAD